MLDEASSVPLYRQLANLLDTQIGAGEYAVGERIPSEPDLCRRYGLGRPTVRQATDLLVRKGLIERRRGAGTFVRERPRRVDMFSRAGTLRSFQASGLAIASRWLGPVRAVPVPSPDPEDPGHLTNPFQGGMALHVSRRSTHDGDPVLLERYWLDGTAFADLEGCDLGDRSLSDVAQRQLGLLVGDTEQVLDVVPMDADAATHLDLPVAAPVLRVQRLVSFPVDAAAIYAVLYCRTDRLAFCQTLRGEDHA